MTKTIPVIATIAIAAIILGSVYGTSTMTTPLAEAHVVSDDDVQSFILCAVETGGQNVIPQGSGVAELLHSAATIPNGLVYADSWTFAIAESVTEDGDCLFLQGYDEELEENIINNDISKLSFPGPAIELNRGQAYEITLANDKDNEHVHSIDMHALVGDEHVNSGPIIPGEEKTWTFAAENVGTFLYHCGANNLNNVWTHIANGMYGSFVISDDKKQGKKAPVAAYSVQFSDMYIDSTGDSFDMDAFMDEDNTLEVTNGQAFNYAPFIGSESVGHHKTLQLNPLDMFDENGDFVTNTVSGKVILSPHGDGDLGGIPIFAPVGETTRWHINNPGPNQFLAFHFIAGQMDIRDGGNKGKLNTVELNEETWTIPPGSASTFDVTFPSPGLYLGVTHKLSDVVKGGAFAVIACDVKNPENNFNDPRKINGVPLAAALCNAKIEIDVQLDGDESNNLVLPLLDSVDTLLAVNGIANPRTVIVEIP